MRRLLAAALVTAACGAPTTVLDGGSAGGSAFGGGAGGGTSSAGGSGGSGAAIPAQSGTIGGAAPGLVAGWARLDPPTATIPNRLTIVLSSRGPFACDTQTAYAPTSNETGMLIWADAADGGVPSPGTFTFGTGSARANGMAYRVPSSCAGPIGSLGFTSGTVTFTSTTGRAVGTVTGMLSGGEQLSVSFDVGFCPFVGVSAMCTP